MDIGYFFERFAERWKRRGEIVEFLFGPFFRFLEAHGLSMFWGVFLLLVVMFFAYFLFDTSTIFTGERLSFKERWKLFWKDFDILKTMTVILTPIIFMFLFAFFGVITFIPLIITITLGVLHFILSTEKYIDKRKRFSFESFKIRWMMYWKGFDFFKGGVVIFPSIVMFLIALGDQFLTKSYLRR